MILKLAIYIVVIPFVIWVLDSINLNSIFKKNKIVQAKIFYLMVTFITSYLIVSFLFDFLTSTSI